MKKKLISCTAVILAVCMLLCLCSCGKAKQPEGPYCKTGIIYDEEFGGFFIDKSIDDFNACGFYFGDSVNLSLSNGKTLEGIPYYNGYYTKTGEPLLCGYPGYAHVKVAENNGGDLWEKLGVDEKTTAEVTLNEAGKYLTVQQTFDMVYSNIRSEFESDAEFGNYRALSGGDIAENRIYRSASPCDNRYNRAPYVDSLMAADGINFILNLADKEENVEKYTGAEGFNSPYFLSLYESGKIAFLGLSSSYRSDAYKANLAGGLKQLAGQEGPYLFHCTEGKDRTGFVGILLEGLCGATYDEMRDDYMETYDNYYDITKADYPDKYDAVVSLKFDDMVQYLAELVGSDPLESADYRAAAEAYLLSAGMTEAEIAALREALI